MLGDLRAKSSTLVSISVQTIQANAIMALFSNKQLTELALPKANNI